MAPPSSSVIAERDKAEETAAAAAPSTSSSLIPRPKPPPRTIRTPLLLEDPASPLPPRPATAAADGRFGPSSIVRLVVLSDTHGSHRSLVPLPLPNGDVFLHLGDVADRGRLEDVRSFVDWMGRHCAHLPERVVLEGNHDRDLRHPHRLNLARECGYDGECSSAAAVVPRDEVVDLAGGRMRALGASWDTCELDDFAVLDDLFEEELYDGSGGRRERGGVKVLLTHVHPYVPGMGRDWRGSRNLTELIRRRRVALHLFGHRHRGRGICVLEHEESGDDVFDDGHGGGSRMTVMVNCATMGSAGGAPVVIDYDVGREEVVMVHCPCIGGGGDGRRTAAYVGGRRTLSCLCFGDE